MISFMIKSWEFSPGEWGRASPARVFMALIFFCCCVKFRPKCPLNERIRKVTIEEAIKTALQYEGRVVAIYSEAMDQAQDPVGKKIFKTLKEEEIGHVHYLKERLDELRKTGRVVATKPATAIPAADKIEAAKKAFQGKASSPMPEAEIGLLRRALDLEVETSSFYMKMARDLPVEDRALFEHFIEIEEGHQAIVQAEIDSVSHMGFWFDMAEFQLEAE
jgi:rubrerythrin